MDDYHFYEEVGRGSSSVVFKGRRKKTIEYVAIKSVDKAQMARVRCRGIHACSPVCMPC